MTATVTETPVGPDTKVGPKVVQSDTYSLPLGIYDEESDQLVGFELYRCQFTTRSASGERNSCGVQAFVKIVMVTGNLYACGHCYAVNADALAAKGALEIHDQRGAINAKPAISANAV